MIPGDGIGLSDGPLALGVRDFDASRWMVC